MKGDKVPMPVLVIGIMVALILGFMAALFVKVPPEVQTTISVGDIISLVSIIAAIFIIPFMIDRYQTNKKGKRANFLGDLKEFDTNLKQFWNNYNSQYFKHSRIKESDRKEMLSSLRSIQNQIDRMNSVAKDLKCSDEIKKISDEFSKIRETVTENYLSGKTVKEHDYVNAQSHFCILQSLVSSLKYVLFS